MKRKIFCILLSISLLLGALMGCAPNTEEPPDGDAPVPGAPDATESGDQSTSTESASATDSSAPDTTPEPEPTTTTATILTPTLYLFVGDSYPLNYVAEDPSLDVEWLVSTDCAKVENGTVYALKEGHAVVTAGESSQCSVKILSKIMPELYVSTGGVKISSNETYVNCDVTLLTENEDYTFEYEMAGIRLRGNSTKGVAKKPYRIKFDSKINMLGMNDGAECKSWVLLAEWFDDSLIRNSAGLSLAGSIIEDYSSDWRYVKLILNGEDKGVYVLAEQNQINKYRVDIEEAGADTEELRSGYLYEIEGSRVNNGKFFVSYEELDIYTFLGKKYTVQSTDVQTDGTRHSGIYLELKNDDVSAEQIAFAEKYAQNIFTLIYAATFEDICYVMDEDLNLIRRNDLTPEEAISLAVDVDSMARMYIFAELVCNFDAFKKSSFFYVDFSEDGTGKLTFTSPWDHDRAFVKNWDAIEHEDVDEYYTAEKSVFYVMMMNHEWFRALVGEIWEEVSTNSRDFNNAVSVIERASVIYAEEFREDGEIWNRKNDQYDWAMQTHDWILARIRWLDSQFTAMKA